MITRTIGEGDDCLEVYSHDNRSVNVHFCKGMTFITVYDWRQKEGIQNTEIHVLNGGRKKVKQVSFDRK